jgi:hypothetical protein
MAGDRSLTLRQTSLFRRRQAKPTAGLASYARQHRYDPGPHPAIMHCILVGALLSVKSRGGILRRCFLVVCAWGRGAGARGQAPVARFACNLNFQKPFWFIFRGVVLSDFPWVESKRKRADPLFSSYPLFFGGCLLLTRLFQREDFIHSMKEGL